VPVAVPEGTTRNYVKKTDIKRRKCSAEAGPSEQVVDSSEDDAPVSDMDAPPLECKPCGGVYGWDGVGGSSRRSAREQKARWDEVSAPRLSSALEREGAQVLYTLESDHDDDDDGVLRPLLATYRCSSTTCHGLYKYVIVQCSLCALSPLCSDCDQVAHSFFHTHPRLMCWGEQGAGSGGGGIMGLQPNEYVEDLDLVDARDGLDPSVREVALLCLSPTAVPVACPTAGCKNTRLNQCTAPSRSRKIDLWTTDGLFSFPDFDWDCWICRKSYRPSPQDARLVFGAECATTDQAQTLFSLPLLASWHDRVHIAANGLHY
jgi:hypothetical protein